MVFVILYAICIFFLARLIYMRHFQAVYLIILKNFDNSDAQLVYIHLFDSILPVLFFILNYNVLLAIKLDHKRHNNRVVELVHNNLS